MFSISDLFTICDFFSISEAFIKIGLLLDSLVYNLVDTLYQVFFLLAGAKIFSNETVEFVVGNIYIIMGVVMLFMLAYSMLTSIINPDNMSKSDTGPNKLLPNIVLTLVLLVITPSLFSIMYSAQNTIVAENVIANIFVKNGSTNSVVGQDIDRQGALIAWDVYSPFFALVDPSSGDSVKSEDGITYNEIEEQIVSSDRNAFDLLYGFAGAVDDGDIYYMKFISFGVGCFLVYLFFSFSLDLALRAAKLTYFQIIAPIPIIYNIVPGGKKIFTNWYKKTITTFFEVFIRLIIIYLAIFLIQYIRGATIEFSATVDQDSFIVGFVKVMVILGIIMFAKQAPKLVGETFGIDSGNLKLGIRDKLADGGVMRAGAALGGGLQSSVRGVVRGKGLRQKVAGGVGGFFGGGARGYSNAKDAKTWGAMNKAQRDAVYATDAKRNKRANYRANKKDYKDDVEFDGGLYIPGQYRAKTILSDAKSWVGASSNDLETYKKFLAQNKSIEGDARDVISKKLMSNTALMASMQNFKGFKGDNAGELQSYFDSKKGGFKTLQAWKDEVDRFSSMPNRTEDQQKELSKLSSIYQLLSEKEAVGHVIDDAVQGTGLYATGNDAYKIKVKAEALSDIAPKSIIENNHVSSEKIRNVKDEIERDVEKMSIQDERAKMKDSK